VLTPTALSLSVAVAGVVADRAVRRDGHRVARVLRRAPAVRGAPALTSICLHVYISCKRARIVTPSPPPSPSHFLCGEARGLVFDCVFTVCQILWSFSIWMEAVAILPQVAVMQTDGMWYAPSAHTCRRRCGVSTSR
jgi:hypothetical protein